MGVTVHCNFSLLIIFQAACVTSFVTTNYRTATATLYGLQVSSSSSNSRRRWSAPGTELLDDAYGTDPLTWTHTTAFETLAANIALCLVRSDLKRDTGFDGASTGWTSWIDEATAAALQTSIDDVTLAPITSAVPTDNNDNNNELQQDEIRAWLQWIQTTPAPAVLEFSHALRHQVNATLLLPDAENTSTKDRDEFLRRIGCRVISLPSGQSLNRNLQSPPGAMVFGKLLRGGVTRYRLLGSSSRSSTRPKRRAGERTLITAAVTGKTTPGWLQYGGPERNYQAVDIGACLVMEIVLLPKGLDLPLLTDKQASPLLQEMTIGRIPWNPNHMLTFASSGSAASSNNDTVDSTDAQPSDQPLLPPGSSSKSSTLQSTVSSCVGGLQPQIAGIVRRVLDGRVLRSVHDASNNNNNTLALDQIRREEMQDLLELGLHPVRGLLLYGPPGNGKTALAREISRVLNARSPKIVAAPELLDRWVGGSERLVRELFADAEEELRICNGDPTRSNLHVVVIDEIDAVFRKRSSTAGDGEVTRASAVNQILAKMDGINALGNVLLVGMTNRRELLDPALLRPGRLEVHVEIPVPDQAGRRDILQIHFGPLRSRGRLSRPLCEAIDGCAVPSSRGIRRMGSHLFPWVEKVQDISYSYSLKRRIRDLASDRWTGGFSGADIAGLVRCAGSLALARSRNQGGRAIDSLLITVQDVLQALEEVKQ